MAAYNNLCDIFTLKEIRDIILFRTKALYTKSQKICSEIFLLVIKYILNIKKAHFIQAKMQYTTRYDK